jgi:hypothetical protein
VIALTPKKAIILPKSALFTERVLAKRGSLKVGSFKKFALSSVSALALPAALAAMLAASPAGATVITIASSAYDVGVDLTILGGVAATIGPFVQASGVFPLDYNLLDTLTSASASVNLRTGGIVPLTLATVGVSTGLVKASASSAWPSPPTTTASSTVDNLSLDLRTPGLVPITLLDVTATTITSTSTASALGPLTATGSSSIEDLRILGTALGILSPIDILGTVTPSPNDVILSLAGLTITLNQQIETVIDGGIAIETNAIAIDFSNFVLGTGLVNGDIIIANSFASVPEPATWVEMLAGFGAVGFLMVGRAKANKTAAA